MLQNKNNIFDIRILLSVFIILAGVILLADNLGFETHIDVWEWWPLVLIFIGIGHFARPSHNRQPFTGFIFLGLGIIFLGNSLDLFYLDIGDLWPVILILIGLAMIRNHMGKSSNQVLDNDSINLTMMLGGGEYRFASKKLKGGKLTAFMGGGTLDLTDSEMEGNEIELDVFAMMGGMEVRIPKHWQLNSRVTPILGGVEDKTRTAGDDSSGSEAGFSGKRLTIRGTLIMGGLEVRN